MRWDCAAPGGLETASVSRFIEEDDSDPSRVWLAGK